MGFYFNENKALNTTQISKCALSNIAPIFNLFLAGCKAGVFNQNYLEPLNYRHIALQLLTILFFGQFKSTIDGKWYKAYSKVVLEKKRFIGFIIVRYLDHSQTNQEIYLISVAQADRNKGYGTKLLRYALDQLKTGYVIQAECLPKAVAMKSLLLKQGFQSVTPVNKNKVSKYQYQKR
jgi:ribosomal protein S18 acetylase RimI-like enzyme